MSSDRSWRERLLAPESRWILLIGALVLVQLFVGNASTPLWDQDEAAYAGFARGMLRSGDWVVPRFLWSDVHRKPPLLFWCIAACFRLFGASEFAVRLPTTLAILGTISLVGLLARPLVGARAAAFAALALATSLFVPNLGKVAVTDSLVLLCDTAVALALARFLDEPRWRWVFAFWTSLALGLLAKGPPTLLLAGGLFGWTALFDERRRLLIRLHPWIFLPLALAPLAGWGYLAWQRTDGALIRWMWSWYIAKRAGGGTVFGQIGPPGYHFVLMLAGLLPWSALLPLALTRWRELWTTPRLRILLGWLVFGWLAWEFMPSKLPAYAIGGYPAVALLLGRELDRLDAASWQRRSLRVGVWLVGALALLLGAAILVGAIGYVGRWAAVFALLMAVALMAGVVSGARALKRGDVLRVAQSYAGGALGFVLLAWIGVVPAISELRDVGRSVARAVDGLDSTGLPVTYGANLKLPSIAFYVGRHHQEQASAGSDEALQASYARCSQGLYVLRADQPSPEGALPAIVRGWNLDGPRRMDLRVAAGRLCGH